jgi:predicted RNase H-like nuclease (RuvC/YqgF family)
MVGIVNAINEFDDKQAFNHLETRLSKDFKDIWEEWKNDNIDEIKKFMQGCDIPSGSRWRDRSPPRNRPKSDVSGGQEMEECIPPPPSPLKEVDEVERLRIELAKVKLEKDDIAKENVDLHAFVAKLDYDLVNCKRELDALRRNDVLNEETRRCMESIELMQAQVRELQYEKSKMKSAGTFLIEKIKQLQADLQSAKQRIESLRNTVPHIDPDQEAEAVRTITTQLLEADATSFEHLIELATSIFN